MRRLRFEPLGTGDRAAASGAEASPGGLTTDAPLKLRAFRCGFVRARRRLIEKGAGEGFISLPVFFFLTLHPEGALLYDCGQPLSAASEGETLPAESDYLPEMRKEDFAPTQLRKAGIPPESVVGVVVSHLHSDHAGALGAFPKALHLIRQEELDSAGARSRLDALGLKLRILNGESFDVFGDGSVKAIALPGHTPGHQGLLLNSKILLAGDAFHTERILDGEALPGIAWDERVAQDSLERLRRARAEDTLILGAHSPEASSWL